jgi:hypothetical protein
MSARFNPDDYVDVDERIDRFWSNHPGGAIRTAVIYHSADGDNVAVLASVYKTAEAAAPDATGIAQEYKGQSGANKTSWWENCETSAIGRALANLGMTVSKKRPSRQEMQKVQRHDTADDALPTPTPLKVEDWPDERLLAVFGQGKPEPQNQRAATVYIGRATDRDTLIARMTAARKAGLSKEIMQEVGLTHGDALGLPRKQPAPPSAPLTDDELTAVVGDPAVPNARRIALLWSVAAQHGWDETRVRNMGRQIYRSDDLGTWSSEQIDSFITFIRQGSHNAAAS